MIGLIRDNRGRVPTYVVVDDPQGVAVLKNQFTGEVETVGARPYSMYELKSAVRRFARKAKTPKSTEHRPDAG